MRVTFIFLLIVCTNISQGTCQTSTIKTIDLRAPNDTFFHVKGDNSPASVLSEIILDAVRQGKLVCYSDSLFKRQLSLKEAQRTFLSKSVADTNLTFDKETGSETLIVDIQDYDYFNTTSYRIMSAHGMKVGIAPMRRFVYYKDADKNRKVFALTPMYWVRYVDLEKLLSVYVAEPNHNSVADNIFQVYFSK